MDASAYRPNERVLKQLKRVDFVTVAGPTAAGKTTLIKAATVANPKLHMLVAGASREPRPGEWDGVDFHFSTKPTMEARAKKGDYATVVVGATGDLYTTAPEDYTEDKVVLLAALAEAIPLFRSMPYRQCRTIFVVPPDYETWYVRLKNHDFTLEQLKRRLAEAERSLVFGLEDEVTHFVINQSLDVATGDFIILALGKPMPERLQADQPRARVIITDLLTHLRASF